MNKIIGSVLIIGAIGLGYMGYQESQSVASQLSSAFNGQPTDHVLIKYIGAAILGALGLVIGKK
jgi:uncharacterized membrane protein YidH (DUF202 family)